MWEGSTSEIWSDGPAAAAVVVAAVGCCCCSACWRSAGLWSESLLASAELVPPSSAEHRLAPQALGGAACCGVWEVRIELDKS